MCARTTLAKGQALGPSTENSTSVEPGVGLLANGTVLDLVQDPKTRQPRVLVCTRGGRTIADGFEHDGCLYRPPLIGSSVARAISLPTHCRTYESTAALFALVQTVFAAFGMPEKVARLCTYFTFATWFPTVLLISLCLVVSGPPTEVALLWQALRCVVWGGLPLGNINLAALGAIVGQLHPTLLIDVRHLNREGRHFVSASSGPKAYHIQRNSLVDFAIAKAVYVGAQPDPELDIDFALPIHLTPSQNSPCLLDERACEQISADLQPCLLEYRIRHLAAVRGSTIEFPELQAENRVVASVLGRCIQDAPDIQAGIQQLLEDREDQNHRLRLTDPTCVVVEALLAKCHEINKKALLVKSLAQAASLILRSRGEALELEPRAVGAILDQLGIARDRQSRGFQILLSANVQRQIHRLALDYDVRLVNADAPPCSFCAEVFGSSPDTSADKAE